MQPLKTFVVLASVALVFTGCTDTAERALTAPETIRFAHDVDPAAAAALKAESYARIDCVFESDNKKRLARRKDFDNADARMQAGDLTSAQDKILQAVRDTERDLAKLQPSTSGLCTGDKQVDANFLFNAWYLYFHLGHLATNPFAGLEGAEDIQVKFCPAGEACELEGTGAFMFADETILPQDVIMFFYKVPNCDLSGFSPFQAIPPCYEFNWQPEILANEPGVERYACVSVAAVDENGDQLQLAKILDGGVELIPHGEKHYDCTQDVYGQLSNPFLRGAAKLASFIGGPFQPKLLYASRHAAIGGPAIAASKHAVIIHTEEQIASCDVPSTSKRTVASGFDVAATNYPFTNLLELKLYLSADESGEYEVSVRAFRPNGSRDLGTITRTVNLSATPAAVNFLYNAPPTNPGGVVQFDIQKISGSGAVSYSLTAATSCPLTTFAAPNVPVAGGITGNPQGPQVD